MLPRAMHTDEAIADVENELARLGCSRRAFCAEAGIAASTWTRWKAGLTEPNLRTWRQVEQTLANVRQRRQDVA